MKRLLLTLIMLACFAYTTQAQQPPGKSVGKIISLYPEKAKELAVTRDANFEFNKHYYEAEGQWVTSAKRPPGFAYTKGMYSLGFIYFDAEAGYTMINEGLFDIDVTGHAFRDTAASTGKRLLTATDYLKRLGPLKTQIPVDANLMAIVPDKMLVDMKLEKTPGWLPKYRRNNPDTIKMLTKKILFGHIFNIYAKNAARHIGEYGDVEGILYKTEVRENKMHPDSAYILQHLGDAAHPEGYFTIVIKVKIIGESNEAKWARSVKNQKPIPHNSNSEKDGYYDTAAKGKIILFESKPAVIISYDEIEILEPIG